MERINFNHVASIINKHQGGERHGFALEISSPNKNT